MFKRYQSTTGIKYNFLVKKNDGNVIQVMFRGCLHDFSTRDVELQKLIEATDYFKMKKIAVVEENEEKAISSNSTKEQKPEPSSGTMYNNVADMQSAIDVLVNDFGVSETELQTPAAIRKMAKKLGVEFPNLA